MATLGCIKAKMGRTTYYICKMAAGELIDRVGIAKELPEWPDMTAEEKMQRECDIKRIEKLLAQYPQIDKWNVDFEDWEKILRIECSGITALEISEVLRNNHIFTSELE